MNAFPDHARRSGAPAAVLLWLACACAAGAVTLEGKGWRVHYNLPDQDPSYNSSRGSDEYAIRDALIARIAALRSGQRAALTTFTFSGESACCGAAGPMLKAIDSALERGAKIDFVVARDIAPATAYGGLSLKELADRARNPLRLARDPSPAGIMHDKLGLFDGGKGHRSVFITSWNFTGGASSQQWNIALELENEDAFRAYRAELDEFMAGRFHASPEKSHAHDGTEFTLPGSWGASRVRFMPCAGRRDGGRTPAADIVAAIDGAQDEIVFALNKLNLDEVLDALLRAAARGVTVRGVIPKSDAKGEGASADIAHALARKARSAAKAGGSVKLLPALSRADGSSWDKGEDDLIHAKYMVIDAAGERPLVIHGSANWTAAGLIATDINDENICFIRHAGIARAFLQNFRTIIGEGKP